MKPTVKLLGEDGNAAAIMGAYTRAARKADWHKRQIDKVLGGMMSSDYDHLLRVASEHFDIS